jgi:hypothetical protein
LIPIPRFRRVTIQTVATATQNVSSACRVAGITATIILLVPHIGPVERMAGSRVLEAERESGTETGGSADQSARELVAGGGASGVELGMGDGDRCDRRPEALTQAEQMGRQVCGDGRDRGDGSTATPAGSACLARSSPACASACPYAAVSSAASPTASSPRSRPSPHTCRPICSASGWCRGRPGAPAPRRSRPRHGMPSLRPASASSFAADPKALAPRERMNSWRRSAVSVHRPEPGRCDGCVRRAPPRERGSHDFGRTPSIRCVRGLMHERSPCCDAMSSSALLADAVKRLASRCGPCALIGSEDVSRRPVGRASDAVRRREA